MSERRARRRLMNEINVVPYIDVMLVLLVIFMITAPLITPGEIELPQVSKSLSPPVAPLEVIVKANGTLRLNDRSAREGEKQVSHTELVEVIKQKQAANAEQPVVIAGDKNVRYEEVMNVMDILQQQQVKKVGLLARSK
ncbi:Cell division and transport-associated protein TolR [Nitrosospira multiformis ATCC 25196]|uniref:Cell division and transport-associated protein TolR n=2 Tax=Nitrosospira multiformis TaxID=1231 RepID=Q2Y5G8_NITMU|nr:Cell division and transport-associated protein TolR [Nitrosospira multiformis ATCC 25196]SEA47853.1 Cell division and transport-associated protein TolR [Nitrosospira multiformis]SEF78804.1 Cell division and transport-associated protein TolR [Nitrosospira multiformis ATCC 25196]